ncbi:hypothetical protein E5083_22505 [Streptomyces bauhiniae]|uniref:Uncharacterized protein n=1 Tax=Streptomyces bauhiniae TaxID=2340725 RepID=A0A4Z1D083_9ACTN|nr:hypothetical protein E5083_22505 [Streptomyces bauhiniae]
MADPSEAWCVQMQGGGGRQRGALATDDNAADVRATPCDAGMIQTTGPRLHPEDGGDGWSRQPSAARWPRGC